MDKYFLTICILMSVTMNSTNCEKPKIAIIGGGIAGTSCALFLKDLLKTKVEIHIYEKSKIGGRISSMEDDGRIYEVGAPFFEKNDTYVLELMKRFDLKSVASIKKYTAIYKNGKLIIPKVWNKIKAIGPVFNISLTTGDIKLTFKQIYKKQQLNKSFLTIDSILEIISKDRLSMDPTFLKKSDLTGIDLFEGRLVASYGNFEQYPIIPASIQLEMNRHRIFSIEGGNIRLVAKCYEKSEAILHLEKVVELERTEDSKWKVISIEGEEKGGETFERYFNYVVIANPLAENLEKIEFSGNIRYLEPIFGEFQTSKVITIIEGYLDTKLFKTNGLLTKELFFIDHFNRINMISKLNEKPEIWRIQSDILLSDVAIKELFHVKRVIKIEKFIGYPDYSTRQPGPHERFIFTNDVFYINCIEWVASSVEMSLIAAKNVAILISKKIGNAPPNRGPP